MDNFSSNERSLSVELRSDVAELANTARGITLIAWNDISNRILNAADEIERLTALVSAPSAAVSCCCSRCAGEIERLRAALYTAGRNVYQGATSGGYRSRP